ncbi:MAG: hypothetical protein AAGF48_10730 [Pseudomonadota bacterium]
MPTLFRFLAVLGSIAGVVAGSLYVLAEYFQPEPKEISKALRGLKAEPRPVAPKASSAQEPSIAPPPSHRAQ